MHSWNRDELYSEVWESPLVKVALKYNISAVALGKICRKLQIPLPGRGYWAKKEVGKAPQRVPLPEGRNIPTLYRSEHRQKIAIAKPTSDPELVHIASIESEPITVNLTVSLHPYATRSARLLRRARVDASGIIQKPEGNECLDIRVSKETLDRALSVMSAFLRALERVGCEIKSAPTEATVFAQRIRFALIEQLEVKEKREVKTYFGTQLENVYQPTSKLCIQILDDYPHGYRKRWSEGKRNTIEELLPQALGGLLRFARGKKLQQEEIAARQLEWKRKEERRAELSRQIAGEEKKVRDLENWVSAWARAGQIRNFIAALELIWRQEGHDLSTEAPRGQRLIWMQEQADRLDPMVPSPPSILDRKGELGGW